MTETRERHGAVVRRGARSLLQIWATAALLALAGTACGSAANTSPGISPSVTSKTDTAASPKVETGPADQPRDIFARVHGWIVYGKPGGGPLHLTDEGTWEMRREGIWAVNPERPGHREDRVRLSDQAGDPIAWSADGSALLILRVWSPDGTVLSNPGPSGTPGLSIGLVVLHADGTETRAVTFDSDSYPISGSSLSPDGSQVIFATLDPEDAFAPEAPPPGAPPSGIYVVDSNGGTPRLLRRPSGPSGVEGWRGEVYSPAFSPDGTKIAYFDGGGDHDNSLKVMNADGTNVRVLFGPNQMNGSPLAGGLAWSPDGSTLAFHRVSDPGTGIWLIRADGSGLRQAIADGWDPSWSPDGSRIAYRHAGAVYVAKPDGTRARRISDLVSLAWFKGSITWNPLRLSASSEE